MQSQFIEIKNTYWLQLLLFTCLLSLASCTHLPKQEISLSGMKSLPHSRLIYFDSIQQNQIHGRLNLLFYIDDPLNSKTPPIDGKTLNFNAEVHDSVLFIRLEK